MANMQGLVDQRVIDGIVAGYLVRQNYVKSLDCLMEESTVLRQFRKSGTSFILNDCIYGKNLEEIIKRFVQFGDFELPSTFLDFGLKLRTLANEYTALTSPDRFWSDAQKVLYGRCAPPFEKCASVYAVPQSMDNDVEKIHQQMNNNNNNDQSKPSKNVTNSANTSESSSLRRKCPLPVSMEAKRKELLKEIVEPVVHSAQQYFDGGINASHDSSHSTSFPLVDDSIIGSLDRFIYNEHFEELIESIECEMPLNLTEYFDTSSGIEEERKSGQAVRQEIKSGQESLETSDVIDERFDVDNQNLSNIPLEVSSSFPSTFTEPQSLVLSLSELQQNSTEFSKEISYPKNVIRSEIGRLNYRKSSRAFENRKPALKESTLFKDRVEFSSFNISEAVGSFTSNEEKSVINQKNSSQCRPNIRNLEDVKNETIFKTGVGIAMHEEHEKKTESGNKYITPLFKQICSGNDSDHSISVLKRDGEETTKTSGFLENVLPVGISKEKISIASQLNEESNKDKIQDSSVSKEKKMHGALNNEETSGEKVFPIDKSEKHVDQEPRKKYSEECNKKFMQKKDKESDQSNRAKIGSQKNKKNGKKFIEEIELSETSSTTVLSSGKIAKYEKPYKNAHELQVNKQMKVSKVTKMRDLGEMKNCNKNEPKINSQSEEASICKIDPASSFHFDPRLKVISKYKCKRIKDMPNPEKKNNNSKIGFLQERDEFERKHKEQLEKEKRRAIEREQRHEEEKLREEKEKEEREKKRKEKLDKEKMRIEKEKQEEKIKKSNWVVLRENEAKFASDRRNASDDLCRIKEERDYSHKKKMDSVSEEDLMENLFGDETIDKSSKATTYKSIKSADEKARAKSSFLAAKESRISDNITKVEESLDKNVKCEAKSVKKAKIADKKSDQVLDEIFNTFIRPPQQDFGFKDSYKKDQAKDSQRDEVMKESFFKDSVQPATSTERSASKMVVTSGINKGRENLLVGGGHSARVGMVLEKAMRMRLRALLDVRFDARQLSQVSLSHSILRFYIFKE